MRVVRETQTVSVPFTGVVLSGNRTFEVEQVVGVILDSDDVEALQDDCDIACDGVYVTLSDHPVELLIGQHGRP